MEKMNGWRRKGTGREKEGKEWDERRGMRIRRGIEG